MSSVDTSQLQALGNTKQYDFNGPHAHLLEKFDNPFHSKLLHVPGSRGSVHIEAPEFTSLCPMTGQPDFATIVIDYIPGPHCVESKSLKLYLGSFRNVGEFHESCIARMGRDLVELLEPVALRVEGRFTPRGGIPFWPVFEYGNLTADR
jgi:7-cyano-7-deazaguanine reductase